MIVLKNIIVKQPGHIAGFFYACQVRRMGFRTLPFHGGKRSSSLLPDTNINVHCLLIGIVVQWQNISLSMRGSGVRFPAIPQAQGGAKRVPPEVGEWLKATSRIPFVL